MHSLSHEYGPSIEEIRDAFFDEITRLGGSAHESYVDDTRLYLRARVPGHVDVAPGDQVGAGVAIRMVGPEISVHPFTVRQVCTNGAVHRQRLEGQKLERITFEATVLGRVLAAAACSEVLWNIREQVRECAKPEAFRRAAREMEDSLDHLETSQMYRLLRRAVEETRRLPSAQRDFILEAIMNGNLTGYEVGNRVTARARELPDPEHRWQYERIGALLFAWSGASDSHETTPRVTRTDTVLAAAG